MTDTLSGRAKPMSRIASGALALVIILGIVLTPQKHAFGDIGTTAAVNPSSLGTPPGEVTRVLVPELNVFADERIQTDAGGVTQILFRDGTHMTIGPHSDLVIDRFVFDPDASTGEMAISLGQGILRFVGGQLSKEGAVTLATPVAVIGVRGGIAVVEHDPAAGTNAVFLFGTQMTVQGLGEAAESVRVSRPGFSVSIGADGAPGPAVPVEPERLDRVLAAVEGDSASDGGAPSQPTDAAIEQTAYVQEDVHLEGQSVLEVSGQVENDASASAAAASEHERREPLPTEPPDPVSPAALLVYDLDGMTDFRGSVFNSPGVVVAEYPLTIVKPEGPLGNSSETGGARFFYTANGFAGTGADQAGDMRVIVGAGFNLNGPSSDYRLLGRLGGSSRAARQGTWMMTGIVEEYDELNPAPAFGGPTSPSTFRFASGGWDVDEQFYPEDVWGHGHLDPDETYEEGTVSAAAELLETIPLDRVENRGTRNWNGYASGLLEARTTVDDVHTFEGAYSLFNTNPTDVRFDTYEDDGLGVQFNLTTGSIREGSPDSREMLASNFDVTAMQINFGYPREEYLDLGSDELYLSGTRGVYVDDTAFAALSSVLSGEAVFSGTRLIYVNGQLAPSRWPTYTRTWMVSNDAAPAAGLLSDGARYCDCDAARFGWWGGHIGIVSGAEGSRADALFPGTFVVGDLPGIAEIPNEGMASYTGHAAAAIRNGGAAYAAVGHFAMDWNFATRSGHVEIDRLDNRSYTAAISAAANSRDFSGDLSNVEGAAASGDLAGSFFASSSSPVADAGGRFDVQTSDGAYTAVGAFAATSQ